MCQETARNRKKGLRVRQVKEPRMQNHTQTQAHEMRKGRNERSPNRLDNSFGGGMGLACQDPDQTTDDPGGRIGETMPT
jgi:hypothetical protein